MLYNTDGCHGKFLKYQIQVKNEIVLIPPISGSLCARGRRWWGRGWRRCGPDGAEGPLDDAHQPGRKKYYLTFSRNLGPPEKVEDELGLNISGEGGHQPQPGQVQVKVQVHFL